MAPAIRLRSAVALLGRFPALAGADLTVDAGEIVLLRGPNGAGKTSLLRVCAGLLRVTAGEAEVLGHDLREDPTAVRRGVGLLGHASFLYDDLTVGENVLFWVKAAGGTAGAANEALVRFDLGGRLRDVAVGRLSAGQRRRTAVAVVAARKPQLWLLDEPHAGLDAEGRDLIDELVREAATEGRTVLMASHDADRAAALAQRTLLVAGGQVHAVGVAAGGPEHDDSERDDKVTPGAGESTHVA